MGLGKAHIQQDRETGAGLDMGQPLCSHAKPPKRMGGSVFVWDDVLWTTSWLVVTAVATRYAQAIQWDPFRCSLQRQAGGTIPTQPQEPQLLGSLQVTPP